MALPYVFGIAQSLGNQAAARSERRRGERMLFDSNRIRENSYLGRKRQLEDLKSQGAFDAARQNERLRAATEYFLNMALGNDAVDFGAQGGAVSDTRNRVVRGRMSERAAIDLGQQQFENEERQRNALINATLALDDPSQLISGLDQSANYIINSARQDEAANNPAGALMAGIQSGAFKGSSNSIQDFVKAASRPFNKRQKKGYQLV